MDISKILKFDPCEDAVLWLKEQSNFTQAWNDCQRGDWMLWLLSKLIRKQGSPNHRKLVLASCACARLSLKYVKKGEKRPLKAIQVAESWANGKVGVTLDDLKDIYYGASCYADEAYYAGNYAAAFAADSSYGIYIFDIINCVAVNASWSAYYANVNDTIAAFSAISNDIPYLDIAADTARYKVLLNCANIVRKFFPNCPRIR